VPLHRPPAQLVVQGIRATPDQVLGPGHAEGFEVGGDGGVGGRCASVYPSRGGNPQKIPFGDIPRGGCLRGKGWGGQAAQPQRHEPRPLRRSGRTASGPDPDPLRVG
jgi:hypothetical protein